LVKIVRIIQQGSVYYGLLHGETVEICQGTPFSKLIPTGAIIPLPVGPILPPCTPSKMVAVWRNSRAYIQSIDAPETVDLCYIIKPPSSFIGSGDTILLPAVSQKTIFEAELGIVVGQRCKRISEGDAPKYILGYTVVNEVTASDIVPRDKNFPQHTRAKSFDTFGVFGPSIDTDFNPSSAMIRAYQNDELRQDFAVSDLIRGPHCILSELSYDMTLEPGDVIACGSSLGIQPMHPGDEIVIEIPGLGRLANPVANEVSR
jgi:2-keto-4-pentenoate hydratase/2-oxohepta-3-ene-1,7-dioic acid hydratase in catechol pathway